jgi:hypothetical protein
MPRKTRYPENMPSTRKKTRLSKNTQENWRKRRRRSSKKKRSRKIRPEKSGNCTSWSRNRPINVKNSKKSMKPSSLRETFWERNSLEGMMKVLYCMRRSKSNRTYWLRERLSTGKGFWISPCWTIRCVICRDRRSLFTIRLSRCLDCARLIITWRNSWLRKSYEWR